MSLTRLVVFLSLSLPALAESERPNILWLIGEDFGPHLGCYGTKEVTTPVLDAMAGKGMRYTRYYTTAPVCSASRSAFNTGMYQTRIGAHNHRSHRDDGYTLPAGVKLISERMKEAGYFTANVRQMPAEAGFKGAGKTDWNFQATEEPFESDRFSQSTAVCPPSGTLLVSGRSQLLSGLAQLLGTLNSMSVSYGGQNKQSTVL